LAKVPIVRGLTLLWDSLGLGTKSLMFSAEVALAEEASEDEASEAEGQEKPASIFEGPAQWGTVALSLSFSVALFFVLPAFLAGKIDSWVALDMPHVISNLVEGAIRLTLLIGYIWIIGFMSDIRRLFGYHGAEHKTINAYEAGAELTPEKVSAFPLEHPRCGTAFLLTVVVISVLFYSLLPAMSIPVRVLSRVVLLPVVAGIGYEFIRFTARHQDNRIIRTITKPNLALQRLTTREPELEMLEVAIFAFKQVLASEVDDVVNVENLVAIEATASD
jgi:uncharacterized protein YqhQ